MRRWMRTNNHSEGTLKSSRVAAAGAAAINRRGLRGLHGWPPQRRGQRDEELLLPSLHGPLEDRPRMHGTTDFT